MKTSKKLLSLLLVLAMVFALGCTAYASDAETADTAEPTEETGDTTAEAPAEGEEAPAEGEEAEEETPAEEEAPAEETPAETASKIVIIHTNDIHGAIDGYAKIAALKAEYEAEGAAVLLMDAGDFSQGTVEVSSSKGATAVELMNLAGYDLAGIGNHEFDYSTSWPPTCSTTAAPSSPPPPPMSWAARPSASLASPPRRPPPRPTPP